MNKRFHIILEQLKQAPGGSLLFDRGTSFVFLSLASSCMVFLSIKAFYDEYQDAVSLLTNFETLLLEEKLKIEALETNLNDLSKSVEGLLEDLEDKSNTRGFFGFGIPCAMEYVAAYINFWLQPIPFFLLGAAVGLYGGTFSAIYYSHIRYYFLLAAQPFQRVVNYFSQQPSTNDHLIVSPEPNCSLSADLVDLQNLERLTKLYDSLALVLALLPTVDKATQLKSQQLTYIDLCLIQDHLTAMVPLLEQLKMNSEDTIACVRQIDMHLGARPNSVSDIRHLMISAPGSTPPTTSLEARESLQGAADLFSSATESVKLENSAVNLSDSIVSSLPIDPPIF